MPVSMWHWTVVLMFLLFAATLPGWAFLKDCDTRYGVGQWLPHHETPMRFFPLFAMPSLASLIMSRHPVEVQSTIRRYLPLINHRGHQRQWPDR